MSPGANLAWETREPDRTRHLLAAVGFLPGPGNLMMIPDLTLMIVRAGGPDRLRPDPGGRDAEGLEAAPAATRLLAVGVAAVDLERPGATFPLPVSALPADDLLGARVAATGVPRTIILEPATEGRLAAGLARHGEGPAALYLEVVPGALAAISVRLVALGERPRAGNGPFGAQLLASRRHPSGPYVLLVDRAAPPAGPAGGAWSTIEP